MKMKAQEIDDETEKELMDLPLGAVFEALCFKVRKNGKTAGMIFHYADVRFEILCEKLPEKVIPRGYQG